MSFTRKPDLLEAIYTDKHYELIIQAKAGNAKAQYQLYKLYVKQMFNISMRIVNHVAEAEDVVQETFVYAFMKLDEFRHEASFGSWLKQIVVNRSINVVRKRKTDLLEFKEELEDIHHTEPETNEEDVKLQVDEIRQTIQELPEGYRIVLSLYLLEGYDHEEIAEVLNIAESTSRTQYMRAKQKLLAMLKMKNTEKLN